MGFAHMHGSVHLVANDLHATNSAPSPSCNVFNTPKLLKHESIFAYTAHNSFNQHDVLPFSNLSTKGIWRLVSSLVITHFHF